MQSGPRHDPHPRHRALVLLLICVTAALLLTVEPLHDALLRLRTEITG